MLNVFILKMLLFTVSFFNIYLSVNFILCCWQSSGLKAKTVVHLSQQQQYPKKELITLKALPANKRNKILRGVREDLKKEILRHHQERNFCPGSTDYKGSSSLKGLFCFVLTWEIYLRFWCISFVFHCNTYYLQHPYVCLFFLLL